MLASRQSWRQWWRNRLRPRRRAIPTRAGLFVLAAPLPLGVAAVSASNNLLFMLLAVALGAVVLSGILSERNIDGVQAHLRPIAPAYVDEPCRLEVRYERSSKHREAAFALQLRELAPGVWKPWGQRPEAPQIVDAFLPVLDAGAGRTTCLRVFAQRGRTSIPTCELITRFPFGLLNKAKDVHVQLHVLVRARRVPVPEEIEDPRSAAGEGERAEARGLGTEIYGLRERQDWDEAFRVHALRSMALGRDVVLETAQVQRPTAWLGVAITPQAEPVALERTLEIAAAALSAWDVRGFAVGLATPDIAYAPGELSVDGLLDVIADLSPAAFERVDARHQPGLWLIPDGAHGPRTPGVLAMHVNAQGQLRQAGQS